MKSPGLVFIVLLSVLFFPAAFGQGAPPPSNLLGNWSLTTQAFLPNQEAACNFGGTATITEQTEGSFSGIASMTLINGPEGCPAELSANVEGTLVGNNITMAMLLGGDLGTGSFSGTVLEPQQPKLGADGVKLGEVVSQRSIQGSFSIDSGPFSGVTGSFSSAFLSLLEAIPTLSGLGLLLLALLLAAVGWVALRRVKTKAA